MTTFLARTVVSGGEELDRGWVQVTGDRVVAVGRLDDGMPADGQAPEDLGEVTLVPGFVDIHCHGGGGAAFTTTDPDEARRAAAFHSAHGTTSMLASLVSEPLETISAQVDALHGLVEDEACAVDGVHLEGPWLSHARCGAHDPALLRDPSESDVAPFCDPDRVRMITFAPELTGALDAIRRANESGVIAGLGHTDATVEQFRAGIDAGARVATHLFNGMRPFHHRDPGPVGAALTDPMLTVEVINDGYHLDPDVVRVVQEAVGTERMCFITDAIVATGMGDGTYRLGDLEVVVQDGTAHLATGSQAIAGSTLTMDRAFANAVNAGMTLTDAVQAATRTPAVLMGWYDRSDLAVGHRADMVVLDLSLQVERVMRAGDWVEAEESATSDTVASLSR